MRRSLLGDAWLPQFGGIGLSAPDTIVVTSGAAVNDRFHAEAHYAGVLGADFTYSATLEGDWSDRRLDLRADLQFRISDEGRYGVSVQAGGRIVLYRFTREDLACADDPAVIAHCPDWKWPEQGADDPIETELADGTFDAALPAVAVTVTAQGPRFEVSYGAPSARAPARFVVEDVRLGVGRFGVYARAADPGLRTSFRDLSATTDPTSPSNFALLHSTPGYDLDGTKRALVRTLNDIAAADFDVAGSAFGVYGESGDVKIDGRAFEVSTSTSPGWRRTQGFQFLAADFSDLKEAGRFVLEARLSTSSGLRVLRSQPFEIAPRLVTQRMVWPASTLNARARRAADDDFRRSWYRQSGANAWSVGLDGAFIADRADDAGGAVLWRFFDTSNRPFPPTQDFRMAARIAIVSGCDAQLQFRITGDELWAVTLQAGAAGGCVHRDGPGAVRLHREGIAVPAPEHFDVVASQFLGSGPYPRPFEAGRDYDVEVIALGGRIEVLLDGIQVLLYENADARPGTFALKAWGSTARFSRVQVWRPDIGLRHAAPGVWIPFDRRTGLSSSGFQVAPELPGLPNDPADDVDYPLLAQQTGFHDCNSHIGEITSHSVFLAALMEVWATRAHDAGDAQQDELREAIVTAVLYLEALREQGGGTGAFAHQEPGRAAWGLRDKALTTGFALHGLSAFAEKGAAVDRSLAREAYFIAKDAWRWLVENGTLDPVIASLAAVRLARAARREGEDSTYWQDQALAAIDDVLGDFGAPGSLAGRTRGTLRSIPWFEGVYEAFSSGMFERTKAHCDALASIAAQLASLVDDPANGFCLMPQGDYDGTPPVPSLPQRNWDDLADLPQAVKPIPVPPAPPVGDWYINLHFAAAAADCVYIGRLVDEPALERLATGNLHWMLGLNPGIPATKVVGGQDQVPWGAAAFVYNAPGAFARTQEGERLRDRAAKGWLADWEGGPASRHRETWAFDPGRTGFQSIVNGYVLREGQWHYWSAGTGAWVSAETFLLIDGIFLKAALALEDWHAGSVPARDTPYDVGRFRFFDTTHFDRVRTGTGFDDPERTPAARAGAMAHAFAAGKGFRGGRPTGHRIGERIGVVCLPIPGTTLVDVPLGDIRQTPYPFEDIEATHWAQVGRAAMEIAAHRNAAAGYFTGYHAGDEALQWIGFDAGLVEIFDALDSDDDVANSPWKFADIDQVPWAQAARLATDICIGRGLAGGYFSGHQLPGRRQVVAYRQT